MRAFSFGGGVQSMAALVLAAHGELDYPHFLFVNVGEDSENPDTLAYFRDVALPYAAEQPCLTMTELVATIRGQPVTLYGELQRRGKSLVIPVRLRNGNPAARRCTADMKVKTVAQWMRVQGHGRRKRGIVGLGISLDEAHRMSSQDPALPYDKEFPLVDLRLTRDQCVGIIAREGLPVPPKSSCFFCPWHTRDEWRRLKREHPDLYQRSVDIEGMLQARSPGCHMTDYGDLETATQHDQGELWPHLVCESGYCMT